MGGDVALLPQFGALRHPEAVLFVDDDQPDVPECDYVLQQGVGADEDLQRAVAEPLVNLFAFLLFGGTGEQGDGDIHLLQHCADGFVVLRCQDFRGSHEAGLETIVKGNQHAHDRHQRLPASHIALQQAVHLFARAAVLSDFPYHALLGAGEGERKMAGIERVEVFPHGLEHLSFEIGLPLVFQFEDIELDIEQLLQFEAVLRLAQHLRGFREVDVVERFVQVHEFVLPDEPGGEGFGDFLFDGLENGILNLADGFRIQECLLHFFRGRVHRLESHEQGGGFVEAVDFRMDDIQPAVEFRRLPENQVFLLGVELPGEVFESFEPHQFQRPRVVVRDGGHALRLARAHRLQVADARLDLNVRQLLVQFRNGVNLGAVDILVGHMIKHVLVALHAQLFLQDRRPLVADAGQEFNMQSGQFQMFRRIGFQRYE